MIWEGRLSVEALRPIFADHIEYTWANVMAAAPVSEYIDEGLRYAWREQDEPRWWDFQFGRVRYFCDLLRAGVPTDPVDLSVGRYGYVSASDGYHRLAAHVLLGLPTIAARILGNRSDLNHPKLRELGVHVATNTVEAPGDQRSSHTQRSEDRGEVGLDEESRRDSRVLVQDPGAVDAVP